MALVGADITSHGRRQNLHLLFYLSISPRYNVIIELEGTLIYSAMCIHSPETIFTMRITSPVHNLIVSLSLYTDNVWVIPILDIFGI